MASVRARIASAYRLRFGAMALLVLGISVWFLYDGYVAYPAERDLHHQYEAFVAQNGVAAWPDFAHANGLPDGTHSKPGKDYSDSSILTQKILGFIGLPFGLIFVVVYLRTLGRWVQADEAGISTNTDEHVPYASVTNLDKRRWKRKGIAVVSYDDGGRIGKIVLDDWKYDREATVAIFNYLEAQLTPEKITDAAAPQSDVQA